jgi:mannose-1-phosphate guanylyltransferase/mannose-6-phosphate isomerase
LDFLVTFGITPTGPETGFGYIKAGAPVSEEGFRVEEFVEKPGEDSAKRMLEQGGFSWNSGMFVFKAGTFLQELEKRAPDVYATAKLTFEHSDSDGNVLTLNPDFFSKCPNISIDYAVMEKTDKAAVLPVTLHWTDLGSWSAFYDSAKKDSSGNALIGDTLCLDTKNSYIRSTNRLVATVGVDNLAIIETQDAVLVSPIDKSQEVRAIVDRLKKDNRPEAVIHNLVYRPWGSYESLAKGERFQVKRIIVQPGEELSLQLHHHRAEHWIVVAGTAEVQVGTSVKLFTENQSTYIPVGEIHRMRNPGKIPLVIIEVQSGSYLGEDDIVRLEDKYKRI